MKRGFVLVLCSALLWFVPGTRADGAPGETDVEPTGRTETVTVDDAPFRIPIPSGFHRNLDVEDTVPPSLEFRYLAFLCAEGWDGFGPTGPASTTIELLLLTNPSEQPVTKDTFASERERLLDRMVGQAKLDHLMLSPDNPHRPGLPWRELGDGWCCAGFLIPSGAVALGNSSGIPISQADGAVLVHGSVVRIVFGRAPSNDEEDARLHEEAVRYVRDFVALNPCAESTNAVRVVRGPVTPAELARRLDRGLSNSSIGALLLYHLLILVSAVSVLGCAIFGLVRLVSLLRRARSGKLGGEPLPRALVSRSSSVFRTLATIGFATVVVGIPSSLLATPVLRNAPTPRGDGILAWGLFIPLVFLCGFSAKAFARPSKGPTPRPRWRRDVWASVPFWIQAWFALIAILSIPTTHLVVSRMEPVSAFQSLSFLVLPELATAVGKSGIALCGLSALRALRLPPESGPHRGATRAAAACALVAAIGKFGCGLLAAVAFAVAPLHAGAAVFSAAFDGSICVFLGFLLLRCAASRNRETGS